MGRTKKEKKTKLKPVPVYLTEEKHAALTAISENKRIPMTKLLEAGVDDLIKKEAK